ncbi:isoprenylcysteine carboxyl methyltransferase (ICMT) family protein [Candidatus Methanoperedens nitroreducens]|uniref:Isoprenylcysteine carboxyl methyltransferase (ICMT) family protein n=1 Tax=Candidatus Methanoperedens nitratireducens TaxID=1392998 RepID=A0A062V1S3_9EURY|nr:methyltransferase [Candidatus Methanoperedens nitroreducens]KCZ71317.1 isoprenylcysteine carboxyl methyltransferase (ICMT) family protein [Candidatus Methanoperedens nitroreducens]MDJ1420943.1 methyltransferase [Candidatus Methanoperedens sp.]
MTWYGNWVAVIASILFFTLFAAGFAYTPKKHDWKTLGIYEAFMVALFTEMFGFPLTIFLLSSILGISIQPTGETGHLIAVALDHLGILELDKGVFLVMAVSSIMILTGLALIVLGWKKIHKATGLVKDGIYRYSRHPQYLGILLITSAFIIQWPTILTVIMWPILLIMYVRLAKKEEKEMEEKFGEEYLKYKEETAMLIKIFNAKI